MTSRAWAALLACAGLGVALYLSVVHYTNGAVPLACSSSGPVNCEEVTTSPASYLGPVPVALLGLVWFVVLLGLVALEPRLGAGGLQAVRLELAWTICGLLFVFYLVYAELFLVGALCLWCTAVHALTAALFLLTLWRITAPASQAERGVATQPEPEPELVS